MEDFKWLLVVAVFLSATCCILTAVGLGTVGLQEFDGPTTPPLPNPMYSAYVTTPGLPDERARISFFTTRYGFFIGCVRLEGMEGAEYEGTPCATTNWGCAVPVCFRAALQGSPQLCTRIPIYPIVNCSAYNAARVMGCVGGFIVLVGMFLYFYGFRELMDEARDRVLYGCGACVFGSIMIMITFAVWFGAVFAKNSSQDKGLTYGYSICLIITAWVLGLVSVGFGVGAYYKMPDVMDVHFDEDAPDEFAKTY